MRIAQAASECFPLAKTGGLGDVVASLARYLNRAGHDVRTFLPLYGNLNLEGIAVSPVGFLQNVPLSIGGRPLSFSVFAATLPGSEAPIYLVACSPLYGRKSIYANDGDEHLRFAFLAQATLVCCQHMGWAPDVVHAHDWHTALLPIYLRTRFSWDRLFERTRTVLTLHNLAYQGVFPADQVGDVDLGGFSSLLHQDHLRAGRFGFLETGILYADVVTAVSRTYAREILEPEGGMGLDALLRARASTVVGIANGVDYEEWSPERDAYIPFPFSAADLSGKEKNRAHLLASLGLVMPRHVPLLGVVSRFTPQKGLDLAFDAVTAAVAHGRAGLVALGGGSGSYTAFFQGLARAFPHRAAYRTGHDHALAHRIEAGADMFLMPSRFEPCGLNQMYSLRYGTVPIVRKTGGLADTVEPYNPTTGSGTGFVFEHATATGFAWALERALETWRDRKAWTHLMRSGMARDFSWERQVERYVALYRAL